MKSLFSFWRVNDEKEYEILSPERANKKQTWLCKKALNNNLEGKVEKNSEGKQKALLLLVKISQKKYLTIRVLIWWIWVRTNQEQRWGEWQ